VQGVFGVCQQRGGVLHGLPSIGQHRRGGSNKLPGVTGDLLQLPDRGLHPSQQHLHLPQHPVQPRHQPARLARRPTQRRSTISQIPHNVRQLNWTRQRQRQSHSNLHNDLWDDVPIALPPPQASAATAPP